MAYREENGQVVLTMSRRDYEELLMLMGFALGRTQSQTLLNNFVRFTNRLNSGNPNYTPYEVKA